MLVKVRVALAAPDVCGLKVTVNGALWPAGIVRGSERPPTLKIELFVLAAVTVTFAPLAVKLPEAVALVPATTLPRPKVVGTTVNCPETVVPVPESEIVNVGFDASLLIVTVALKASAALGVNVTLSGVLCPALIVTGRLGAVKEKYLVETDALLILTDAGPEFVTVTVRVLLLLAATLPKSSVAVNRERVLECCWPEEPAALTPWQPTRKVRPARRTNAPATFPRCFEQIALAAVSSIFSHGTVPGCTTVCTRGRAHHESGATRGIAVDLRGTPRQPPEGQQEEAVRTSALGIAG